LRELIRSLVHQTGMNNDGTEGAPPIDLLTDQKIIEELIKIRTLPEQKKMVTF
jgi:hypothetical protein